MKKQIKIEVPTNWDSITLQTYLNLQKDLETYSDNEQAQTASMFHHICGLDPTWVNKLSLNSYNTLKEKLNSLVNPANVELVRFVTIDGLQYGFEPNLSKIAYGAYSDISSLEVLQIDKNWPKVMNILYRPVVGKAGELYQIEPYKPNDEWDKWLGVSMEVHFGAWFFFINLRRDLLNAILKSSIFQELPPNIKSILAKSGKLMQQYSN
jgi:hypothetical protein